MTIVKLKIHPSSPRIGKGTPLSESFRDYTLGLIGRLRLSDRCRTAESYLTSFNSFMRFRDDVDVSLDKIDADLMTAYEGYLRREGICPNTSSYYKRNLRAIYNRAVEDGLTVQCYPFRRVYTGIDRTVKRAVPLQVIGRIRNLDLSLDPRLDYARDLFMFSFYTRGMSFVDMAYLKKKDLRGGFLSYYRHKTRQFLSVRWERPMQDIVDKYDTADTPYLLPIIRDVSRDDRNQYLSAAHQVNLRLKELGAVWGWTCRSPPMWHVMPGPALPGTSMSPCLSSAVPWAIIPSIPPASTWLHWIRRRSIVPIATSLKHWM